MDTFAFIIHPIDVKRDVMRKYPFWGRIFTEKQINFLSTYFPPVYISEIEGIRSQANGKEIKGWFIACPYTPARMLELPEGTVYRKIIQTGQMAERLGAQILGLGAFTSVVGDAGITIAKALQVPVTTGDSYTVAIAIQAILEAARRMEIPVESASAAVVGATGAIGSVCAELLAHKTARLHLIGRRPEGLETLQANLRAGGATAEILHRYQSGGPERSPIDHHRDQRGARRHPSRTPAAWQRDLRRGPPPRYLCAGCSGAPGYPGD